MRSCGLFSDPTQRKNSYRQAKSSHCFQRIQTTMTLNSLTWPPPTPRDVIQARLNGGVHATRCSGDMEGEAVWLRIVKAIEELLSKERPDDAEVH